LVALARANARYWPRVAPAIRRELRSWRRQAEAIPSPSLRALACAKLDGEAFNAEVAGALATTAHRAHRLSVVRAIVAIQVMYDYLDGLTEQPVSADPCRNARHLFQAFTRAVTPGASVSDDYYRYIPDADDGGFLEALAHAVKSHLEALPALDSVADHLRRNAVRGAHAQAHVHSPRPSDRDAIERWAVNESSGTALGWRSLLAASTSSVISVHALVAAAGDPSTTAADAAAIDAAYLPICAVSTMLDALVDQDRDASSGELRISFMRYCGGQEWVTRELPNAVDQALSGVRAMPRRAHHLMMLVGVVAYYTTDPGARCEVAQPQVKRMHRKLRPFIWPTLAILRSWRGAKRLRAARVRGRVVAETSQIAERTSAARSLTRGSAAATLAVVALASGAATLPAWGHTLNGNAEAKLHYLRSSGSTLIEEGPVSGGLSGRMNAVLNVGATFTGSFVFHTRYGEIRGHGSAHPHAAGRYETFSGSDVFTGGTGRYAHAHGRGAMYGSFDHKTYNVQIQTRGALYY
jgi:tetraprenyl-beta-curcumene synthase